MANSPIIEGLMAWLPAKPSFDLTMTMIDKGTTMNDLRVGPEGIEKK